ncbi:hypothetical protein FOL47_008312 [Perkinsus chesapeaki]|uniref:Uncharacterized protein n=1 Tax=Perkinsus chesapeaki TaxID=330153 RepID=A0A7J6LFG7_PERCH|nr:hypothetical protein FOL47_008312 [Perkinsus chesapeaki]
MSSRPVNEGSSRSPSCPPGFPEYMCNNHTVHVSHTTVIYDDESPAIANMMRRYKVVGLGIQCNAGWNGIQAISVATIEGGVYIYILRKPELKSGLRSMLENPDCVKVVCGIPLAIQRRLRANFQLDLGSSVFDIGDADVKSAGAAIGVRVFVPKDRGFRNFTDNALDLGHMGYLSMNCIVPLMVAAYRRECGLRRNDCDRMRCFLKLYNVNKDSREAFYRRYVLGHQDGPSITQNLFETPVVDNRRDDRESSRSRGSLSETSKRRRV